MNSTQVSCYLKTFLMAFLFAFFFAELSFAKTLAAQMAAFQDLSVSSTVNFYKKKQRSKKLTVNESDILKLSLLAQDIFGIKNFSIPDRYSTEKERIQSVDLNTIANQIRDSLQKKSNWHEPVSKTELEIIKKNKDFLKTSLGEVSYPWAWLSYQMGGKQVAKNILDQKFENSYADTMRLTEITNRIESPMHEGELLSEMLIPLSTEEENKSRADRLKKMRTHISSLPEFQIMT